MHLMNKSVHFFKNRKKTSDPKLLSGSASYQLNTMLLQYKYFNSTVIILMLLHEKGLKSFTLQDTEESRMNQINEQNEDLMNDAFKARQNNCIYKLSTN